MPTCEHPGVTSVGMKFCPDCGQRVNICQREPGELRAMMKRLPEVLAPLVEKGGSAQASILKQIVKHVLRWALGEISDEDFVAEFQPCTHDHKKKKKETDS